MLAFSDSESEPTEFVLFTRNSNPSRQDIDLGQDQLHIELNDQLYSGYVDVEHCVLSRNRLVVQLAEMDSPQLNVDGEIVIQLNPAMNDIELLADRLTMIMPDADIEGNR